MGNKMYILDNGYIELDQNQMLALSTMANVDDKEAKSKWIQIPIYCVLIHNDEKGWILFDTGHHPDGMKGRLSPVSQKIAPYFHEEEQRVENQLAKVGLKPEDINILALSHMHCDHAGGLYLFTNTPEVYVTRENLATALVTVYGTPDINNHAGYIKEDVTEPVQNYRLLSNKDTEIAPGVTLLYLPGHVPGMMGLLVELDGGNYIFPVDITNLAANYGPPAKMSGIVNDSRALMESIEKVRDLEKKYKAKVMFPHDMAQFKTFKLAPEYYE